MFLQGQYWSWGFMMIPPSYIKHPKLWVSDFTFMSKGQILFGTRSIFQSYAANIYSSFSQVKQRVFKMSS